jgi:hypothetical protein
LTLKVRRIAKRRSAHREPRRVSPYEIPTVADYAHWGEDAQAVWWEENKYDMAHPDESRHGWDEDDDRRDYDPDPFEDSFDTEAEAQAFAETLSDSAKDISAWGRKGQERWFVTHYDTEAHARWLLDV